MTYTFDAGPAGSFASGSNATPVAPPRRRPRPTRERRQRALLLSDLLAAAVERNPSGVALSLPGEPVVAGPKSAARTVTYEQLDTESSALARTLIEHDLGAEDLVAIAIPRSYSSVLSVWAVAKTGAAFVPIDPRYPVERIQHMLSDSAARFGITTSRYRADLPDTTTWLVLDDPGFIDDVASMSGLPIAPTDRVRPVSGNNAAYVIYTSGSTGVPKGVVVAHAGLSNFCIEQVSRYELTEGARTLHFASPSFDASVLELLLAVGASSTMVVVPTSVFGGDDLTALMSAEKVTHAFVTPAALASVDPAGLGDLRVIIAGGEACPPDLVTQWGTGRQFFNGYGPTETTIMTNISEPLSPGDPVTIGGPTRGVFMAVLDEFLAPVPPGTKGELYLWGPGIARGYHRRAGLTASRFVANPFAGIDCRKDDLRMYRTGDVVRWRDTEAGNALEHLGRSDFQVKVRGFRIELGEIDAAFCAHPSVEFAVTVGRDGPSGSTFLASYVLGSNRLGSNRSGSEIDTTELTAFVADRLPSHMVPSVVVELDHIPLTPVGKLDRAALPEPVIQAREFRAPGKDTERAVASVFEELLGIDRIGLDDDFFDLGGNSLIATQAVARVSAALGRQVSVRALFEASTVEAFADAVDLEQGSSARPPVTAVPRPEVVPLSLAQRRYWFLNRFDPSSAVDNIPFAVRLTGDLDVPALVAAIDDVVDRHESLRTYYPESVEGPEQVVLPIPDSHPGISVIPLAGSEVPERLLDIATTQFDVTRRVPLRMELLEIGPGDYVLGLAVHHITADGSSIRPLVGDIVAAYAARAGGSAPQWAPLQVQYADFALWQRRILGSEDDPKSLVSRQVAFWGDHLAGVPEVADLPLDRPRPAVQTFRGAAVRTDLSSDVHSAVIDVARATHTSAFMVIHAALSVLLARISPSGDVVVGTPVAGRGDAALDDLVGMFVNTLPLRNQVDMSSSFAELLEQVRDVDLNAFANADVPFEHLVEVLNPPRSAAHSPVFQVGFTFQNMETGSLTLADLEIEVLDVDTSLAKSDLHFTVIDRFDEGGSPSTLDIELIYATDLFDESTARSILRGFESVISAVVDDVAVIVGDVDLLEPRERRDLVHGRNDTAREMNPAATLVSLVEEQVTRNPDAAALVVGDRTLTYREFDGRVNALAQHLVSLGAGPEVPIALAFERGEDLLVAMYAVVKSGSPYVPLDVAQPVDRVRYVLDTAEPLVVLTDAINAGVATSWGHRGPVLDVSSIDLDHYSSAPVLSSERIAPLRAENTAYIIFTSGSTGKPKGVSVSHAAVVNQLLWKREAFGVGSDDVVLLKTPVTFDLSIWELWSASTSGAALAVAEHGRHSDIGYLRGLIEQAGVTILHGVPSVLDVLADPSQEPLPQSVRAVLAIGEALPASTAEHLVTRSSARVFNLYGPTEAAVSATWHEVLGTDESSVPIGIPEWNTSVYVLDARLHPTAAGVAGELYLAGRQLARGYAARPALTADRFVGNPFAGDGSRMYRTGDLARWNSAGVLEYVGRTDDQVKVRGLRIELGEVEGAALSVDGVGRAVAHVHNGSAGQLLVLYVVTEEGADFDRDAIAAGVRSLVPSYMLPDVVIELAEIPLTRNGKIDRSALPLPGPTVREFREPATGTEAGVADVFTRLLGVDTIGADDDFFELGGNSLLATRIVARINADFGSQVTIREFFGAASVAELSRLIESRTWDAIDTVPLVQAVRPDYVPLAPAQERIWYANRANPNGEWNVPVALVVPGDIDLDVLNAAAMDVVGRHEALRTRYPETDQGPAQVVVDAVDAGPEIIVVDLVDDPEADAVVQRYLWADYDVTVELPLRIRVFRMAPDRHVLAFVVHHISADGYSMGPLTDDVLAAYTARLAGRDPQWVPLDVQYVDYTLWIRENMGAFDDPMSRAHRNLAFWTDAFAGHRPPLPWPTAQARPEVRSSAGETVPIRIDAHTHGALDRLARRTGASLFMVMHAALASFLAEYTGASDITISTAVAGRGEPELDPIVGNFSDDAMMRLHVAAGMSFEQLINHVKDVALDVFAHPGISAPVLTRALGVDHITSHNPLFQVTQILQRQDATASGEDAGVGIARYPLVIGYSKHELEFGLNDNYDESGTPIGITGGLIYSTALFDSDTAADIVAGYLNRIQDVVSGSHSC